MFQTFLRVSQPLKVPEKYLGLTFVHGCHRALLIADTEKARSAHAAPTVGAQPLE
jgi:hypothetical protein